MKLKFIAASIYALGLLAACTEKQQSPEPVDPNKYSLNCSEGSVVRVVYNVDMTSATVRQLNEDGGNSKGQVFTTENNIRFEFAKSGVISRTMVINKYTGEGTFSIPSQNYEDSSFRCFKGNEVKPTL